MMVDGPVVYGGLTWSQLPPSSVTGWMAYAPLKGAVRLRVWGAAEVKAS